MSLFTHSIFLHQVKINYVQNAPSSDQLELFLKVSYMANSISPQINHSRTSIITIEKCFLPIFYFSYHNLSLLAFIHFTLNTKKNSLLLCIGLQVFQDVSLSDLHSSYQALWNWSCFLCKQSFPFSFQLCPVSPHFS